MGYTSVSATYRLQSEGHWPAQIHDTKAAIRWTRANAERIGVDADKIAVAGYSAGGMLALMAAGTNPMMDGAPAGVKIIGTAGERERLRQLGERIEERLNDAGLEDLEAQVEITVTEEGLRIELLESMQGEPFFASGSPRLQEKARSVLEVVSGELARSTYEVVLEGHTDAATYQTPGYTNWELSGDRANAARRVLERGGVRPEKVLSVRGFADRELRVPADPLHPANRRISILLPFRSVSAPDAEPEVAAEAVTEAATDLSEH